MRHVGEKEYARVAAPWASSALLPVLPSTMPSVGMERATLHLSRASELLLGPSSGRNRLGGGCGRPSTYASTLVDWTVLSAANPAKCRVFGHHLGGGDGWRRLPGLRRPNRAVCRRSRSVEEQSEALLAGVRERVCGGDVSGQQAVGRCAQGGTAFK